MGKKIVNLGSVYCATIWWFRSSSSSVLPLSSGSGCSPLTGQFKQGRQLRTLD